MCLAKIGSAAQKFVPTIKQRVAVQSSQQKAKRVKLEASNEEFDLVVGKGIDILWPVALNDFDSLSPSPIHQLSSDQVQEVISHLCLRGCIDLESPHLANSLFKALTEKMEETAA
jgi:hypothetical protein